MIKDKKIWEEFEREFVKNEKSDFYKNIYIFVEFLREAINLGILGKNPLEGIEIDIKYARVINGIKKTD